MASLSSSQDTFEHLVENSPFGVYIVDEDLRLVQVSQGARRTFRNVHQLLGRDIGEVLRYLWPEPLADDMVAHFRHTLETGDPYRAPRTVEKRVDTGELEYYDWRIERLVFPDGRKGVVCQFYDLTERRRMETALRRIKERFRLALDAAGAFVYELERVPGGDVITYGMERVTGYRANEDHHTLAWWYSLIHPEDLSSHLKRFALHLEKGGSSTSVYRVRHKDGAWIWVESTSQVVKDASGRPTKMVGAMVDITQRKQAADALRESEQRMRALHVLSTRLLTARDLIGALDLLLESAIEACGAHFGAVQLFNPNVRRLEIVAQRGFRQHFLDHLQIMHVKDGSPMARFLAGDVQRMIEDVELDLEFTSLRHLAAHAGFRAVLATPMKTYDGSALGTLITLFRHPHRASGQEMQLLQLYARYAADLVVRLRYEQALRDTEQRKDQFIATLAHELRGPLAPLANSLDILKRVGHDTDQVEKARAIMERQVAHLSRLVDDLLDMSRIANHKLDLRMEDVELASVMFQVDDACRPLAQQSEHTLKFDLPAEPILVHADSVRLAQIFINLVTNSCKYMNRGGEICVTVQRDASEVAATVSDTGFGIPSELLPRIFDLFMQVDGVPRDSGGGLGIGLSLVKRLVEMHGGSVTAHSEGVGRGSRFVVRLPIVQSPER